MYKMDIFEKLYVVLCLIITVASAVFIPKILLLSIGLVVLFLFVCKKFGFDYIKYRLDKDQKRRKRQCARHPLFPKSKRNNDVLSR